VKAALEIQQSQVIRVFTHRRKAVTFPQVCPGGSEGGAMLSF